MSGFFQGWYFKAQNDRQAVAVIPSVHFEPDGKKWSSIQIVTDTGVYAVPFRIGQFARAETPLAVKIADNMFSETGMSIRTKSDSVVAYGSLEFGPLHPIRYDIMGPFKFVPFMECRHSVFSMTHTVDGCLTINGEQYVFKNSAGYIEGDRGSSFPKHYAWTQCNFHDQAPASLMLSVAEIPFLSAQFTGILGVVYWRGKEYRLATYLGARPVAIGNGTLVVRQGKYTLTAALIKKQDQLLHAPVNGAMKRLIRESPSCTVRYQFAVHGTTLLAFTSEHASFEYEFDE